MMRPPNLSVHIPSGTRISDPVKTGVAIRMPNSVSFKPSCCLIGTPMTANIIQIMKHTVNDSVLMMTTDHALYCCVAIIHPVTRSIQIKRYQCAFYAVEQACFQRVAGRGKQAGYHFGGMSGI